MRSHRSWVASQTLNFPSQRCLSPKPSTRNVQRRLRYRKTPVVPMRRGNSQPTSVRAHTAGPEAHSPPPNTHNKIHVLHGTPRSGDSDAQRRVTRHGMTHPNSRLTRQNGNTDPTGTTRPEHHTQTRARPHTRQASQVVPLSGTAAESS